MKENHKTLFEEISLYFEDTDHLKKIKNKENYHRIPEKITAVQISENIIRQTVSVG